MTRGHYHYIVRGDIYCIYRKLNDYASEKICQLMERGEEAKATANFMVAALNARHKYLTQKEPLKTGGE